MGGDPFERRLEIAELYWHYGGLLTPRQQRLLLLHHEHDLSLGEIASELGISRQAVHDALGRAATALHEYEVALGHRRWQRQLMRRVSELERALGTEPAPDVLRALQALRSDLSEPGGPGDV